jgi:hypothetical protein
MEFWNTVAGLLRRARVTVPALLIGLVLGATTFAVTPGTYVSSATMVLTTTQYGGTESQDPRKPADLTNPMLNFNPSLTTTSAILIEAMNTREVDQDLGATGSTTLNIDDGRTNPNLLGLNGPFLYFVGRSASADEARRVVLDAQTLTREKLQEWQRTLSAPEKTYVGLADVVPASAPQYQHLRALKYGVLAFLLGLMATVGAAYLRLRLRARPRVPASSADTEAGEQVPASDITSASPAGVNGTGRAVPVGETVSGRKPARGRTGPTTAKSPSFAKEPPGSTPSPGSDSRQGSRPATKVSATRKSAAPSRNSASSKKVEPALLPVPVKVKSRSRSS